MTQINPRHILDHAVLDEVMAAKVAKARRGGKDAMVACLAVCLDVAWHDESRETEDELTAWGWTADEVAELQPLVEALMAGADHADFPVKP